MADGHEDALLVQLGDEAGEGIKLGVGEEADKVGAVAGRDVVALEVEGDVPECYRVSIDVQGADGGGRISSIVFGCLDLAEEILGKVGGG